MAEPEDVQPESSTGAVETPDTGTAAVNQAVTGDEIVGDRPAKNIVAELERKLSGAFNQRFAALEQSIQAALAQRQAPPPTQEYTDEQLSQLANAGSADASRMLNERIARRTVQQELSTHQRQQTSIQQRGLLYQRYPQLADPSHPLTQAAMQAKGLLVNLHGLNAQDPDTDVRAITMAIADHPHLAATPRPASPGLTVPATAAQNSIDGATQRRTPRPAAPGLPPVTDKEWEIAKRYDSQRFKTRESVAKAKAAMTQRNQDGRSALGAVGTMIREDG